MVETRSGSVRDHWLTQLVCPLDHAPLTRAADGTWQCTSCAFTAPLVTVNDRQVYDFRALNIPQTVQLEFCIPVQPLDRYEVVRTMFRAPAEATKRPPVNVAIKRGRPTWRILESDYLAYEDRQSTVPAVRTTTPKSSRKKVDRTPDYLAEMEKAK